MILRPRTALGPVLATAGLIALAACQATPPAGGGATAPAASVAAPTTPESAETPEGTGSGMAADQAGGDDSTPNGVKMPDPRETPPAIASLPGTETLPRLDSLMGAGPDTVQAVLGPPQFMRHDPPAALWQYRGGDCILDFFIYKEGDKSRVTHIEARSLNVVQVDRDACFRKLLTARRDGAPRS